MVLADFISLSQERESDEIGACRVPAVRQRSVVDSIVPYCC